MTLWWNEVQLSRCPILATTQTAGYYGNTLQQQQYQPPVVVDTMMKQQQIQQVTTSTVNSVNYEKVVLMGRGLTGAQVHEEAEFVIDGTDAGPGKGSSMYLFIYLFILFIIYIFTYVFIYLRIYLFI